MVLSENQNALKRLKEWFTAALVFFSMGTIAYVMTSEDLFQKFTPRRLCMFNDEKLIGVHLIADTLIFLAYMGISFGLYSIYRVFQKKDIPFKGFLWMYAGFIFLCGITHFVGVVNLWVTFYWLDGITKLLTAWFSIAVCVSFLKSLPTIKGFKTPEEYKRLTDEIARLRTELGKKQESA